MKKLVFCMVFAVSSVLATGKPSNQVSTNLNDSTGVVEGVQSPEQSATNFLAPQLGRHGASRKKVPGEILVKFKGDSSSLDAIWQRMGSGKKVFDRKQKQDDEKSGRKMLSKHRFPKKFDELLERHKVNTVEPAFRVAKHEAASGKKLSRVQRKGKGRKGKKDRTELFRWYRIKLPTDVSVEDAVDSFKGYAEVEISEPNYEWALADTIDPPITGLPDATTDPDYDKQWHHASAMIPHGWNYLKENGINPGGMHDVVVAVVDSGVDYTHGELAGNMWVNGAEIPGNGIDDDGNGFIDDIHGCNVVSDPRSHSGDPMDFHGHGTHVSGIIAAQAFNGIGGVGVAFNTKIMAVKAAQYSGTLTTEDIAEGILYATDHGAEVINMSFGGYQYSQMVVDVLQVALSQAVLVAAAGNDSLMRLRNPSYPAHLPWVLGVEASTPAKGITWFSNSGYEVRAPGDSIYSTLPNDQYAAWSGTSMATPVISGIAALMRSHFVQREVYSSRFLMGSIVASGYDTNGYKSVVDAYRALTEPPKPGVSLYETWLFDDDTIDSGNDGDGRVDSGETIHLGLELMNRSGQATNVMAILRAHASGAALDDPYVTISTNVGVYYGEIGPFAIADNGLTYDEQGVITGVETPFIFSVDLDCPNDHVIPFELTTIYNNGWDPTDANIYVQVDRFSYVVQRGKNVPMVISEDTTLTADEYWMVAGPVLVEEGATLTIEEGAQLQFGSISDDPYNPGPQNGYLLVRGKLVVEGSVTNPVNIFPSYLVSGQRVEITVEDDGVCDLNFFKMRNPYLTGINTINHGYLYWDAYECKIDAGKVSKTIFHKFPETCVMTVGKFETCLFDAGRMSPQGSATFESCAFLQDNESDGAITLSVPLSFKENLTNEKGDLPFWSDPAVYSNETYVLLPMEHTSLRLAEAIANYYGGHVASVRNESESDFLKSWLPSVANYRAGGFIHEYVYVGLADWELPGTYLWLDESPMEFTDWSEEYPVDLSPGTEHVVQFLDRYSNDGINYWGWKNVLQTSSTRTGTGGVSSWKSFVIRIPGSWSLSQLNVPVDSGELLGYLKSNYYQELKYNAFLSKYWDPNINHWMRIASPVNTADGFSIMEDNYWGTESTALIDHAILDFYDNFTSARLEYGDVPTNSFESTFPFVESVSINGIPAVSVPVVGAGPTTFSITFNRNMDTNTQPYVTFGPSPPHTDFLVVPRDENYHEQTNGWINACTWEGVFWVTPVTGEAYHLMRISGAVAEDDPWLVSGYDVQRFRFRVQTMGVASMTLQANGVEGGIELSWLQDDYDLLAGYNLYRSDVIDGTYEKINTTVIPLEQVSYLDTDITPAILMFYKFSVVLSGMEESDFSNIAAAAALDTVPPVITHAPVVTAPPAIGLRLSATITDNVAIVDAFINYRSLGSSGNYQSIPMINIASNVWSGTIPGSLALPPGVEYYLIASDGISQVFSGTAATPHEVTITDAPTVSAITPNNGPASGGTAVTLSGLQFGSEASVLFGDDLASDIIVISENQINCTTPSHYPALVEVTVLNTNGTQSTLLNGFSFEDENVVVSMPTDVTGDFGAAVEIPLSVANVSGLRAAQITLTYDSSVLDAQSGRLGELVAGWGYAVNTATAGQVIISMAKEITVTGSGTLAYLTFNVVGAPSDSTALTLSSVSLNDGAISATTSHGLFTANAFWSLEGSVTHFNGEPVENASLSVAGTDSQSEATASDGAFSFTNLLSGNYILTPSKGDDANGISAYDASLVLQSSAGLLSLSAEQAVAADVNRSGVVSPMDASYILEHAVGLISVPFPNAGQVWDFLPPERSYAPLNSDLSGQDFTAVLIGDVSGSWTNTPVGLLMFGDSDGGISTLDGQDAVVMAVYCSPVSSNVSKAWVLFKASQADIYSIDLRLGYDSDAYVDLIQAGDAVTAMGGANNTNEAGEIRSAFAGAQSVSGMGELLEITLSGLGTNDLRILNASINEGTVPVQIETNTVLFEMDTDIDGLSDLKELLAGTNPEDSNSVFAISKSSPVIDSQITLKWYAVDGKTYSVYSSTNLTSDDWIINATGIPGVEPESVYTTNAGNAQSLFFKVGVE